MTEFQVRTAALEEARKIRELVLSRITTRAFAQSTGFLEYELPSVQEYSTRLQKGIFFVAHTLHSSNIVGLVDSYASDSLGELFAHNNLVKNLSSTFPTPVSNPFIYINTVATARGYERQRIASALISQITRVAAQVNQDVATVIVHKPQRNIGSIALFSSLGFSQVCEKEAFGDFTFGIYTKLHQP